MKSNTGGKKQGLPAPNPRRAERLAAELRANLKKRKTAVRTREMDEKPPGSGEAGSGE